MAQTFICAPGRRLRGRTVRTSFRSAGMPRAPGVTDLSRDAMPRRLNVRASDGELEALDRASAEMCCSRSQVMRLSDRPSSSSGAHAHAGDQSHIGANGTRHGRPGIPSRRFRCRYSSDGDVIRHQASYTSSGSIAIPFANHQSRVSTYERAR